MQYIKQPLFGIVGLFFIALLLIFLNKRLDNVKMPCAVAEKLYIVRGASMEPFIQEGDKITFKEGYYACNPIKRNDLVLVSNTSNNAPLLKFVKALPGDTISFHAQKEDTWHLLINGNTLYNSQGIAYEFDKKAYSLLSLYVRDYYGILPENAYLVLGNVPYGSLDSSRFGLVDKKAIKGIIISFNTP